MVDQAEIDRILEGGGSDDSDARLSNLEEEVDLIKNSIKRLLIDIRERMNEQDNPFIINEAMGEGQPHHDTPTSTGEVREDEVREDEISGDSYEAPVAPGEMGTAPSPVKGRQADNPPRGMEEGYHPPCPAGATGDHESDHNYQQLSPPGREPEWNGPSLEEIARALREQQKTAQAPGRKKLRLQKVHQLFQWTDSAVKRYGVDRLEMMLDSFRALGYITEDDAIQVKEMARLMPASIGEEHEITSDEFVRELFNLNRILDPLDTSLDRDMIEVMMLQQGSPLSGEGGGQSGREGKSGGKWSGMMERI
ncbi:MAG: hypothetical protein ACXQTG_03570 [Methanoculleaceae archaeon]